MCGIRLFLLLYHLLYFFMESVMLFSLYTHAGVSPLLFLSLLLLLRVPRMHKFLKKRIKITP